jgi:hypothetical protein
MLGALAGHREAGGVAERRDSWSWLGDPQPGAPPSTAFWGNRCASAQCPLTSGSSWLAAAPMSSSAIGALASHARCVRWTGGRLVSDLLLLEPEPEGIGGWLVLPLIALILAPLTLVWGLVFGLLPDFRADAWRRLTSPGSDLYSPYWPHYLVTKSVLDVALSICTVLLLVLFLQRRRQVPLLMTCFYLAAAGVGIFDLLSVRYFSGHVPAMAQSTLAQGEVLRLVRALVPLLIWIPYFRRSVRVRNTFTR